MVANSNVEKGPSLLSSSPLSRRRLYVFFALGLFILAFALGVSSWVQFSRVMGGPVGLFTQTDYPAIVIASRLVSSGRGGELYNCDLQLQEQQRLREEGYLSLSSTESQELKYPYPYAPFIAVLWAPFAGLSPLVGMAI